VFDGHGGWQIADFLSKNIGQVLTDKVKAH
jgi:serine/threonine protein phosphatase PrpC